MEASLSLWILFGSLKKSPWMTFLQFLLPHLHTIFQGFFPSRQSTAWSE